MATIAQLQLDIANLTAQIAANTLSGNTAANPALQVQINADNQQILALQALCFAHGTHILTDRGEVLVEDLKIGDLVVTPNASSECMPIRWIGRQHFVAPFARFGQPVLIRAGALGDGMPMRDMRVSGDHCLYLDGNLVPAKLLANGTTIVMETGHVSIHYVNIELDEHTTVVAEGIDTETYLDTGNRGRFDNADETSEWLASRPARSDAVWVDGTAFAPPLWAGPKLDALKARFTPVPSEEVATGAAAPLAAAA
jgi:hypothetical protein